MAPIPGRSDCLVRAVVSPVSALLRARQRTGGRAWYLGGRQLHLAVGAGVCPGVEQTLPTAFEADQQELPDRRDLQKGEGRGQVSVSRAGFDGDRRSIFC
jgi:hypothetical protein